MRISTCGGLDQLFLFSILIIFYFHFWRGGSTRCGEAEVFVSVRLLLHVFTKGGGSTSCFLFSIFHLRICFLFSFLGGGFYLRCEGFSWRGCWKYVEIFQRDEMRLR